MPKQKLNKKQQELWDELQRKTDEFYDNVPEEEKQKWPNGDLYLPLRIMEQEKQQMSTHSGCFFNT